MTDAQRQGGGAAEADGDGTAHPPLPAGEAATPGEPGTGNSGPAGGGDHAAGLRPAAPGEGLTTGAAQAPARSAVAVAEAPPSAETAAAPEEQPAPASPAPAPQRPPSGAGGQWRPWLRGSAIALLLLAVVALGFASSRWYCW